MMEPPSGKKRVLVVDDEADLRDLLVYNLEQHGFSAHGAGTALAALAAMAELEPDLVVLDQMLPDLPGSEVCRRIRAREGGSRPVVIMLSARSEEIDRVVAFELGVDDYVTKPFSIRELMLRVRSRLRQGAAVRTPANGPKRLRAGQLELDLDAHRVFVGGQEVLVSPLELLLLERLVASRGAVCKRNEILTHVWKYSPRVASRTVDTHVKRLRDKLGPAGAFIHTVRGVGYRFSVE